MAPKVIEVVRGIGRRGLQGTPGQPASITGNGWARVTAGVVQGAATTPTKADVGLSNVDNTSDANKPISTLQAAGLATKQNTSSLSPRDSLLRDCTAWDSSEGGQWDSDIFTDFGTQTGATFIAPFGALTLGTGGAAPQSGPSKINLTGPGPGHVTWVLDRLTTSGISIDQSRWWLKFRTKIITQNVYAFIGMRDSARFVGIEFRHGVDGFRFAEGAGTSSGQSGGTVLAAKDTNAHTFEIRCDGLHTTTSYQARIDGGEWVTLTSTVSTGGTMTFYLDLYGANLEDFDYLAIFRRITRA